MHRISLVGMLRSALLAGAVAFGGGALAAGGKGEFDNQCVMGLASGQHIPTDCALNWSDKDGKTYCFSDAKAKALFLKDPTANLEKAREFIATSEVEATQADMADVTTDQVKTFTQDVIDAAAKANGGAFPLHDAVTDKKLDLVFEDFEFVRQLKGYGFFPDVKFHAKDDEAKKYVLDFWVKPRAGKLVLMDTRIYRAPKKEGNAWTLVSRSPTPWWWIPSTEHPGDTEVRRGWQVMSSIDEHIVDEQKKDGGIFKLKDDVTGEEIPLQFVAIHQPVRKLKDDGQYFACSDFRKVGTTDEFYDIDFWVDEKSGKMSVLKAKVHKVPTLKDGSWVQVPRYNWDDKTSDVVP